MSKKTLNMRSSVRTLSVKVYDEQLPQGWDAVKDNIRAIDKGKWQVIGICHDRDYGGDDFWAPAIEKKHYHIIVRVLNGKNARVEQILRQIGIVYRPEVDKSLWQNHGVETCADYTAMTVYLTHETEQAILDGKERYDLEELVSNLTTEEIKQVREGYVRPDMVKVSTKDMAELDAVAYKLGYELGDFDAWYGDLPFIVRSCAKMKTVRESYERGINKRLESDEIVPRLCVYIQSPQNMGKTHAARKALAQLGSKCLPVGGGGTGKFDRLNVTYDAIVVDDDACPNLLNMADMRYCRAYKRNKDNPPWIGHYLIVTSNLSFGDWAENKCGIKNKENIKAAMSRFYICHLEEVKGCNMLICTSPSSRGGVEVKQEIYGMYKAFRDYYNRTLAGYHPSEDDVDYTDINGDAYNEAKDEARKAAERAEEKVAEKKKRARGEEEMLSEIYAKQGPDRYLRMRLELREIKREEEEREIAEEMYRVEFEESIAEPDAYIEAAMLAMHMAEACA